MTDIDSDKTLAAAFTDCTALLPDYRFSVFACMFLICARHLWNVTYGRLKGRCVVSIALNPRFLFFRGIDCIGPLILVTANTLLNDRLLSLRSCSVCPAVSKGHPSVFLYRPARLLTWPKTYWKWRLRNIFPSCCSPLLHETAFKRLFWACPFSRRDRMGNIMDMPIREKAPLKHMWLHSDVNVSASSLDMIFLTIDASTF